MVKTGLRTLGIACLLVCGLQGSQITADVTQEDTYGKVPVITTDPQSVTVKAGAEAFFSVKAKGEQLSYKWYLNDTEQKNINESSVKIPKVKAEHNGAKIYVVVSNPYGATTSKEATLTVDSNASTPTATPVITSFKAIPSTITAGQKVKLEAIYKGGQGIVTPGYFLLETKHYLEASPDRTTTYNLVVTGTDGKQAMANATVTVKAWHDDVVPEESEACCILRTCEGPAATSF